MKWECVRLGGLSKQPHPSLLWSTTCLELVARIAASHDVFPVGLSTLLARDDVIVVQFAHGLALTAVLALEAITSEDVNPGKLNTLLHCSNWLSELDDRRDKV